MPFQSDHGAEGIGVLEEPAGTRFLQAAALQQQILAGRIGRVVGGDVDRAVHAQAAGGRQLVRLPVGVHQFGEQARGVAELGIAEQAEAQALDRIDRVEGRIAVVVVLGGRIRLVEIAIAVGVLIEVDATAIGQQCAAANGGGAARADQSARVFVDGQAARRACGHVDAAAFRVAQAGHQGTAIAGRTPDQIEGTVLAIVFEGLAITHRQFGALEVLLGDDVHHAGHGVGAVDRRGAVLQHFDAFDQRDRDHVEVDRTVGAGAAVDHAAAIEQHERAVDAQATQVDLGGAVAVLGPVGVGLAAGETGGGRQALQQGFHRGRAGALDGLGVDDGHRTDAGNLQALDVAAGDLDGIQRGGLLLAGLFWIGCVLLRMQGMGEARAQQCADGCGQRIGFEKHGLSPRVGCLVWFG